MLDGMTSETKWMLLRTLKGTVSYSVLSMNGLRNTPVVVTARTICSAVWVTENCDSGRECWHTIRLFHHLCRHCLRRQDPKVRPYSMNDYSTELKRSAILCEIRSEPASFGCRLSSVNSDRLYRFTPLSLNKSQTGTENREHTSLMA